MALAEQIQADLTSAMKARDRDTVATLRMVMADIKNLRVSPGHSGEVSDAETLEVLGRETKKRREAVDAFGAGGRDDLAADERRAIEILARYRPRQLDEDELAALVDEAVAETDASGPGDLGRVMSAVMPKVKGRADGKAVNAMVRRRLG